MEKFFIVTEESKLRKDYFEFKENAKKINEHVINFMKEHNIDTNEYAPFNEQLCIVPTNNDLKLYDKVLSQPTSQIRPFRKNSTINKAWVKSLKDNGLKVISKPYVGFYFDDILGKHSTRLFDINGIVYCSLESKCEIKTPKGMQEIKASEFFKIIEEIVEV